MVLVFEKIEMVFLGKRKCIENNKNNYGYYDLQRKQDL